MDEAIERLTESVVAESRAAGGLSSRRDVERGLRLLWGAYGGIDYRGMDEVYRTAKTDADAWQAIGYFCRGAFTRSATLADPELVAPVRGGAVLFSVGIYAYYGVIIHGRWVFFLVGALER